MTCDDVQLMTSEFIDDELEEGTEHILFGHLETCESCRRFMRFTLRSRATMLHAAVPGVPPSLGARIATISLRTPQTRTERVPLWNGFFGRRFLVPVPAALGGLVLLLLSLGALVMQMVSGPQNHARSGAPVGYVMTLPEVEVRRILPMRTEDIR